MEFIFHYIAVTLYPVAAIVICGIIAWVCKHLFMELLGYKGYRAVLAASIIGTPVHELGHAGMCLLFGHRIEELVLWQPWAGDGRLGYVEHSYNSNRLYQRLGNLFIGAGPIFSGMAVLSLLLWLAFPDTWSAYTAALGTIAEGNGSVLKISGTGLGMLPDMIAEFGSESGSVWLRLLSVLAMLSVSLHITLSPADVKNSLDALPLYLLIALAVTAVSSVFGAVGLVLGALREFNAFMTAMFTVVVVFSAALAALALLIRWLPSFVGR